jgi:hypothetical protein
MRSPAALLSTLVLVACTAPATRAQPRTTSTDAPVDFLLTSAAADFHTHRPPYPARVRAVRIGYATTPEGTRRYMLCGAFLAQGGNGEWTPFATIKTSGYEQWLGTQAAGFCGSPSIVWVEGDFSPALQSRLDSLR